jgi:hypothetical protein
VLPAYYLPLKNVIDVPKVQIVKSKTLLFVALLPLMTLGQKVDLDRFSFSSTFRSLPSTPLDTSYRTYNVTIEGTRLMQNYLNEMSPTNSVILDGWKKLTGRGHITIHIKLDDLIPESMSVKERVEVQKDRTGKEISRRTLYHQQVVYTFAANAEIDDYKGAHIATIPLEDRGDKKVYSSPEFAIKSMAEAYFVLNALKITGDLYRNCVNNSVRYLSNEITNRFGYGEVTVTDHMWILDSRKHPEYMAHRNAFLTLKDVLFGLTAHKPIDGVRQQLQPVIKYFESIKKNYSSSSKHDRKLRYASYFNLAVLYYYLDDPQAMMKEASGLVLNDYDARDGRAFEQTAIRLKNLFENTQINTRHFPIDVESFRGPFETATASASSR